MRNVTVAGAYAAGRLVPHGVETSYRFEVASSLLGPWTAAPAGRGTVSAAQAKALPYGQAAWLLG